MKKVLLFIAAAFIVANVCAQNLEKLWSSSLYSWNTGISARQATVFGGKMYVNDRVGTTVRVIDLATGAEIPGEAVKNSAITGAGIAADDAGNILFTGGWAGSNWTLWKLNTATAAITQVGSGNFNNGGGRSDFIGARGDIDGTAYIAAVNNATTGPLNPLGAVLAWEVLSGARNAQEHAAHGLITSGNSQLSAGGSVTWIDDNRVLITGQNVPPRFATIDFSDSPVITMNQMIGTNQGANWIGSAFGGGVYVVLGGIPYIVLPANGFGSVKVYNVTDPSTPVKVGTDTDNIKATTTTNSAAYVSICAVKTADNEIKFYVWAVDNGAAAYKAEAVKTPVLTPVAGDYDNEDGTLDVTSIVCDTEDAEIRYTTDGTTPTASSKLYAGETITLLEGKTVIKILATKAGLFDNLSEATYLVTKGVGIQEIKTLLSVQAQNGNILVPATAGKTIEVFNVIGQKVKSVTASGETTTISGLNKGQVYIVRANGQTAKVIL